MLAFAKGSQPLETTSTSTASAGTAKIVKHYLAMTKTLMIRAND